MASIIWLPVEDYLGLSVMNSVTMMYLPMLVRICGAMQDGLSADPMTEKPLCDLGPDAHESLPDPAAFAASMLAMMAKNMSTVYGFAAGCMAFSMFVACA
jgi:hypothetical protein